MPAYVIVDVNITDPDRYEDYKKLAGPTVGQFDGRYLARGGATQVLEGNRTPGRVVILEFPSADRAREWWDSKEYAPAKKIRQEIASTEMVLVEAV